MKSLVFLSVSRCRKANKVGRKVIMTRVFSHGEKCARYQPLVSRYATEVF